jgi:hypothetical protein
MAVTKYFLRNAQTNGGTGGTVYDLSATQGTNATLSATVSVTNFAEVLRFQIDLGNDLPETSIPFSVSINAISANSQVQWRFQELDSSNNVVASSSYSSVETTTGVKTGTISFTNGWTAGNRLALSVEYRRSSGGGSRTLTLNVNNADSFVEPDLVAAANKGSFAVTEVGDDVALFAGEVGVSGSLNATEVGDDLAAFTGTVPAGAISGTISATEVGDDTASLSGQVLVSGSLAATEVGDDTFSASGTVGAAAITGSLAATETGDDTAVLAGQVIVSGSLSTTEVDDDIASLSGNTGSPAVSGAMSATEAGEDLLAVSGNVYIEGSISVTESLEDALNVLGEVLVSGDLAATEVGDDIFEAGTSSGVKGSISALEEGQDTASIVGFQYFEYPLPETVLLGVRYGPGGIYVGTATGGGGGTRIEIASGRIVKLIGDTGAYLT